MNITNIISQSAQSFISSIIPEMSAQNKKIAIVATAIFSLITIALLFRCCRQAKLKKLDNLDKKVDSKAPVEKKDENKIEKKDEKKSEAKK